MASSSDGGTLRRKGDRRLFESFVVAGLDESRLEPLTAHPQECGQRTSQIIAPITDICVIFPSLGESVPEGFDCLSSTPLGYPADLNHGSLRVPNAFICYRRGFHKPPLVDIGLLDKGRGEKPCVDSTTVSSTPFGRSANVNNASQPIFLTFRRSSPDAPPSQLVVTHLCVILANKGEVAPHTYYKIPTNLNKGIVGSDVYLCYKKSQGNCKRIAYKPLVLDCFPSLPPEKEEDENVDEKSEGKDEEEHMAPSLIHNVPMFCLPMGAAIECWPARSQQPDKIFSTFVLTDEAGAKFYGASVTFYESYKGQLSDEQLEKLELKNEKDDDETTHAATVEDNSSTNDPAEQLRFYVNCSICIVSKYPFFSAFKRFLFHIHRMTFDPSAMYSIPIERYISHMMYEVSFPTPRRPRVMMQLGAETIAFESYDDSQLPLTGAMLFDTLKCLRPENLMYLMLCALLEQKILIHSLRPYLLTAVSESILALMFPFHWQCPYVPQCPLALAGVLHAPVPFIAGVDSRYFELFEEPPLDVTCFDLDTGTISASSIRKSIKLSMLPKHAIKQLKSTLESIQTELSKEDFRVSKQQYVADYIPVETDQIIQKKRKAIETQIHDAFLKLMAHVMRDYQRYLRPITSRPGEADMDTSKLFDKEAFLASREKNAGEFYRRLADTQLFDRFIQERCFVSDKNAYNAFFDDCIAKIIVGESHRVEGSLLDTGTDSVTSSLSDHTVFIAPPEPLLNDNGEERKFLYKEGFPRRLDSYLFQLDKLNLDAKRIEGRENTRLHAESRCVCLRTKPEIRSSLMAARNAVKTNPVNWSKTLLFYSYSLWFMTFPSLLKLSKNKKKTLRLAFHVLARMEYTEIFPLDQVPFRILISLCGEHEEAALAVKVLQSMRRQALEQNAVTYGVYHRAVMNAKWPSPSALIASRAWCTLRVTIGACARLRCAFRVAHGRFPSGSGYTPPPLPTTKDKEGEGISVSDAGYHSDQQKDSINQEDSPLDTAPYVIEHHPLDAKGSGEKRGRTAVQYVTEDADPLGALSIGELKTANPSTLMSPSRARFLEDHKEERALFKEQEINPVRDTVKEKKSGPSSWFKGLTSSPIIRMIKSTTFESSSDRRSSSDAASTSSHDKTSNMVMSPSFHSLVGNLKRGYDSVIKESVRSGMNNLVNGLNRSYGPNGSGTLFGGDDEDERSETDLDLEDPAFILDSGKTGSLLGEYWWMKGEEDLDEDEAEDDCALVMEVTLSTCTRCPDCLTVIYDEDIMSGWKVDDQTLNTDCPYCSSDAGPSTSTTSSSSSKLKEKGSFVPEMRIRRRWMSSGISSWYSPSEGARMAAGKRILTQLDEETMAQRKKKIEEEIERRNKELPGEETVNALSPLVLRKEMESILANDIHALTDRSLMESHRVVYWNLVYYMRRLALPSHLYRWLGGRVQIRCVYDRPDQHTDTLPLFLANPSNSHLLNPSLPLQRKREVWEEVTKAVIENRLFAAMQCIVNEHRRIVDSGQIVLARHVPLFRDLLFTSVDRFGRSLMRDHLDLTYRDDWQHVPPRIGEILPIQDCPQKPSQRACRKVFFPLDLY